MPTARSLWSTPHSLADCNALFSSTISPKSFLTVGAELPNPTTCACVCDLCVDGGRRARGKGDWDLNSERGRLTSAVAPRGMESNGHRSPRARPPSRGFPH